MSTSWFKWPTWGAKTAEQLEEEKTAAHTAVDEKYDPLIAAAKAKEESAEPVAEGTAEVVESATEEATGGRRRKTKRSKKSKSKRTRTGRKSNRS